MLHRRSRRSLKLAAFVAFACPPDMLTRAMPAPLLTPSPAPVFHRVEDDRVCCTAGPAARSSSRRSSLSHVHRTCSRGLCPRRASPHHALQRFPRAAQLDL